MKKVFPYLLTLAAFGIILMGCTGNHSPKKKQPLKYEMNMKKTVFGNVDDKQVFEFTLTNKNGVEVKILNYGGLVTHLMVPDKKGTIEDVVLGYDSLQDYIKDTPYFGAIVGRYGNRIANGQFSIDGKTFNLAKNNGPNHLHGGIKGFDKIVWDAEDFIKPEAAGVILTYLSPDNEEGYPGNLNIKITYTLTNENELKIDYEAETDKPTVLNLTHHSYFNLKGHGNGDILDHRMQIFADRFTPVDADLIPTGELKEVEGSAMDFRTPAAIGARIAQVEGGYDHNYVLNNTDGNIRLVAKVIEPETGRSMEVYTDQPGIQFYSGNFLDGSNIGKGGKPYKKHFGFCLETQHFPDSPNHENFPTTILRPGEKYKTQTVYKFGVTE
jgi:aldose 1-epimerase